MNQLKAADQANTPEHSTGELVQLVAEQVSVLVRDELKLAQLEMSGKAKQAGKDRYVIFEDSMQIASADQIALEADLGDALARHRDLELLGSGQLQSDRPARHSSGERGQQAEREDQSNRSSPIQRRQRRANQCVRLGVCSIHN